VKKTQQPDAEAAKGTQMAQKDIQELLLNFFLRLLRISAPSTFGCWVTGKDMT